MAAKKRNTKARAVLYSLVLSFVLMIFPVASGIIVTLNNMDAPQRYWLQGAFMLASIAVPLGVLFVTRTRLSQIGFSKAKKDNIKILLYFIPIIAAKAGFLFFGIDHNEKIIVALAFFTAVIGISEEVYFRGMILHRLMTCFSIKQAVLLSSVFFAAVHASQAFSGENFIIIVLTVVNALIFGLIAAEIVVLTASLLPVILWHALYDFINWIASVKGSSEIILIIVQSVIMIAYGIYLWNKLPEKHTCASAV